MEKTFNQAFLEAFLKSENLTVLPDKAHLGDICKLNQEPWVYLHDGWNKVADENKKLR